MSFTRSVTVRFAHIDAAGIVFYPRYFELLNGVIEEYFADRGVDFRMMHLDRRIGVPTVRLEADFSHPSRLGDQLAFTLTPQSVGRSSAIFAAHVACGDEPRFAATITLVCMDLTSARAIAWPDDMRPIVAAAD